MVDVKLSILPNISLPEDSVISVAGDGLMGDKFIKIQPGISDKKLSQGDIAKNIKDAKSLEDMVGEIIFMVSGNE
jgi:phospholipid/cholesterol/gamma-HCH transport system substrate-binding protein